MPSGGTPASEGVGGRAVRSGRVASLRRRLARKALDHMIVASRANMAYLTGFEGLFDDGFSGLVIVSRDSATLLTDGRFAEQAATQAQGTSWDVCIVRDGLAAASARRLKPRARGGRVAIELAVSHKLFVRLSRALGFEPVAVDGLVERARRAKDSGELDLIRRAAEVTDSAFEHACGLIRPGVTEREIALAIEVKMTELGSSGLAFAPIVASGPNASKPHAQTSARAIENGDLVKIDIGARFAGYCSDMTRTVAVGCVDDERRNAYGRVLDAQRRALDAVRVGISGRDLDAVARRTLDAAGLGDLFVHGLGHGVGLDVHELPWIGRRARTRLAVGDVITIEPGVYVPGRYGIRIEDLVALTPGGVQVLSRSPKDLTTL